MAQAHLPSGMVVAQVQDLGHQLAVTAEKLDTIARAISGLLHHVYWHGDKADRFRGDVTYLLPALTHCAGALRSLSDRAVANAQAQVETSQEDGATHTLPGLGSLLPDLGRFSGDPILGTVGRDLYDKVLDELSKMDIVSDIGDWASHALSADEFAVGLAAVVADFQGAEKVVVEAFEHGSDWLGGVGALVDGGVFAWRFAHDPDGEDTYAFGGSAIASLATGLAVGAAVGGPVGAVVGTVAGVGVGLAYDGIERLDPGITKRAFEGAANGYLDLVHGGATVVENTINGYDHLIHAGATGVEDTINAIDSGVHAVGTAISHVTSDGVNGVKNLIKKIGW